jgi:predicted RNase H-like HicB family nuclease
MTTWRRVERRDESLPFLAVESENRSVREALGGPVEKLFGPVGALNHVIPLEAENEIQSELQRSIMNIKAIVHEEDEGGYWAEVPAIPGCATQGETMDELLANLREAIEGCLSVDVEAGRGFLS